MSEKHIYIVTYQVHYKLFRNYDSLYGAIKQYRPWMHYIDNTWFIVSDKSPKEIYNDLSRFIHSDDRLFITALTGNYFGWLPRDAWDWIEKHRDFLYPTY